MGINCFSKHKVYYIDINFSWGLSETLSTPLKVVDILKNQDLEIPPPIQEIKKIKKKGLL